MWGSHRKRPCAGYLHISLGGVLKIIRNNCQTPLEEALSCYIVLQRALRFIKHARAEVNLTLTQVVFETSFKVEPWSFHSIILYLLNEVPTNPFNI